jgi:hypothetical protein
MFFKPFIYMSNQRKKKRGCSKQPPLKKIIHNTGLMSSLFPVPTIPRRTLLKTSIYWSQTTIFDLLFFCQLFFFTLCVSLCLYRIILFSRVLFFKDVQERQCLKIHQKNNSELRACVKEMQWIFTNTSCRIHFGHRRNEITSGMLSSRRNLGPS